MTGHSRYSHSDVGSTRGSVQLTAAAVTNSSQIDRFLDLAKDPQRLPPLLITQLMLADINYGMGSGVMH